MRLILFASSLLAAAPAVAAPYSAPLPAPVAPQGERALADPALPDRLGRIAGVLTKSLMNVPVGELEAAIDGRPATRADRQRTVGDAIGGRDAERRVADEAAASGRQLQGMGQALARSLPAIMQAIGGAQAEIERALGNMPSPVYPRR